MPGPGAFDPGMPPMTGRTSAASGPVAPTTTPPAAPTTPGTDGGAPVEPAAGGGAPVEPAAGGGAPVGPTAGGGAPVEPAAGGGRSRGRIPLRAPADGWWDPRFRQLLAVAGLWLGTRIALVALVVASAWTQELDRPGWARGFLTWVGNRLSAWDGQLLLEIARAGYPAEKCCPEAFMPGYPLAIRYGSALTGLDPATTGWMLSVVAGTGAAVLLWQLATDRGGGDFELGRRAVVLFAVAPFGIFLVAVYTESLFLLLAIGAWLAGSRRRWWIAGLLASGAVFVRINGLFLLAALVVMYLVQMRADRRRLPAAEALALLLPVAAAGTVVAYFHHTTGSWNAWQEAQSQGWGRRAATPWAGLRQGWAEMVSPQPTAWQFAAAQSLIAVLLGACFLVAFVYLRRWPEATYMLLNVAVLVCSTTLLSAARYGLLWFPAFILVAELTGRRGLRWLQPVLVITCLPLLAYAVTMFARGGWVA